MRNVALMAVGLIMAGCGVRAGNAETQSSTNPFDIAFSSKVPKSFQYAVGSMTRNGKSCTIFGTDMPGSDPAWRRGFLNHHCFELAEGINRKELSKAERDERLVLTCSGFTLTWADRTSGKCHGVVKALPAGGGDIAVLDIDLPS